jgi:hypothetical protein
MNIGDRIKLNYGVKEFNIDKYLKGDVSYAFSSIHFNIPIHRDVVLKKYQLIPFNVPIIATKFAEEILSISVENSRRVLYTKSFKIDYEKAIREKNITIDNSITNNDQPKDTELLEYFINELRENNECFAFGMITISERRNKIMDAFHKYFRIYKDELERIKQRDLNLSDDLFFKKSWVRFRPRKTKEEIISRVNGINFITTLYPNVEHWCTPIVSKLLQMGLDDKLTTGLSFSGINLSKMKSGNWKQCYANLDIGLHSTDSLGRSIFEIKFFEKGLGYSDFKTKDFWNDERFIIMLEKVLKSPVF